MKKLAFPAFTRCVLPARGYFWLVSTTALHIIGLVKSLPQAEQDAVCRALVGRRKPKQTSWQRTPDGGYYNPDGLPDDHPFFKILAEDEAARRQDFGPPPPEFD